MAQILMQLKEYPAEGFCSFEALFCVKEGKQGVVVSFLAILELLKESLIEVVQAQVFGRIHVRLASGES